MKIKYRISSIRTRMPSAEMLENCQPESGWLCLSLYELSASVIRCERNGLTLWRPLLPYGYWAPECLDVKNYKWRLNPVWHRMLYSCTHMATVGVKGLIRRRNDGSLSSFDATRTLMPLAWEVLQVDLPCVYRPRCTRHDPHAFDLPVTRDWLYDFISCYLSVQLAVE